MESDASMVRHGLVEAVDPDLLKAIAHPLRLQILAELSNAPMSPTEFHRRHGGDLSKVAYHFRVLAKFDCLEVISTRQVRGCVEHHYELVRQPVFSDEAWAAIPEEIRTSLDVPVYRTLVDQIASAVKSGTMEARPDRCFAWRPLQLDAEGWRRVMDKATALFAELGEEATASAERMAESGEEPIHTTAAIMAFESPEPDRDLRPTRGDQL